ncbi:dihydrofolate reductase [Oceanivirga salmonicida]|uniref:dihydrofolate reductase n=1 Tax=Oceanivirga salmonicida TaxID=1769291 RepID=UPI0008321F63|nr:dihydrofolate reductase family protein [Oceanivirga salmonicida]
MDKKYYKKLKMVVCVTKDNLIGDLKPNGNGLLWNVREELLYFKSLTTNNIVLFGSNTAKYVPLNLIKKDREVYILEDGIDITDLIEKLSLKNKNIFVCGGYSIYKYFLKNYIFDEIYLSVLNDNVEVKSAENPLYLPNINDLGYKIYSKKEFADFVAYVYKFNTL